MSDKPHLEHLRLIDEARAQGYDVDKLEREERNGLVYVVIHSENIEIETVDLTGVAE